MYSRFVDRSLQSVNWRRTDRLQAVLQTSREPLRLERPWDEANQGKIKTRHKEVFLQSTCGQRLESSPGDSCECRVCQRLQDAYDRNFMSDMDDRSRWACQSINQQVTSSETSLFHIFTNRRESTIMDTSTETDNTRTKTIKRWHDWNI